MRRSSTRASISGGWTAAAARRRCRASTQQLWTNKVFYDATQRQTGKRGFILSRYGGWGSERYPGFFTGDAYSEWRVLAYEVAFTARGGNVLVPYISNDIGGFHGAKIPFDLYARWIEFGTFSPILRMHSAHENPLEGNSRMPWVYGPKGVALMRQIFHAAHAAHALSLYLHLAGAPALPAAAASALPGVAGPRSGLPALPRVSLR